jgi:hypothetical protein
MGFIGYGVSAVIVVWVFVSRFYQPRWQVIATFVVVVFLGLSVWVTYSRDRQDIREVVWRGGAEQTFTERMNNRVNRVVETFLNFEFVNIREQRHLEAIDSRLNHNLLIGQTVEYMESGGAEFAHGKTILIAVVSMIPRILWPSKPVVGSNTLVETYSGRSFDSGSSFGAGQVFEFYANFGTFGVIFGFVCLGALLRVFDIQAGRHLISGDWWRCAAWLTVGLSFVKPGGDLPSMAMTFASLVVLIVGLHKTYFWKLYIPVAAPANAGSGQSNGRARRTTGRKRPKQSMRTQQQRQQQPITAPRKRPAALALDARGVAIAEAEEDSSPGAVVLPKHPDSRAAGLYRHTIDLGPSLSGRVRKYYPR